MVAKVFRSSDDSAPVLTGQAGSLIALLDACLVNGYGSKAAAGWTIAYTGTNLRSYKTGRVEGVNGYLYVDDTATTQAKCRGFLNMTGAADAGSNPFPPLTYYKSSAGAYLPQAYIHKSKTADAVARSWTLVADHLTAYLFVECGYLGSGQGPNAFGFGEFYSDMPSDTGNFFISAPGSTVAANRSPLPCLNGMGGYSPEEPLYYPTDWIVKPYSLQGSAIPVTKMVSGLLSGNVTQLNTVIGIPIAGSIRQPNPVDGSIFMSPVHIVECTPDNAGSTFVPRGRLRGLYAPGLTLPDRKEILGTGPETGKTYLSVICASGATSKGAPSGLTSICFEISADWETN
jgi:hypothetical protein